MRRSIINVSSLRNCLFFSLAQYFSVIFGNEIISTDNTVEDTVARFEAYEDDRFDFDTIGGLLPKEIEAKEIPYIVVSDIEVPAGKVVTIEPGTVFLFRNFTGLHVQGRLVAEGTRQKPIIFTSEYDRQYNPSSKLYPNPYDWNGVYIHDNAVGTHMANCHVLYSVYGLISDTKFIRITSGIFDNNGKTDLVIEGKEQEAAGEPFSYALSVKDATVDGVPVKILRDPMAVKRNVFRYSGLAVFFGGCGAGIFYTIQWINSQKEFEDISARDLENLTSHTSAEWELARSKRNRNAALATAGYGVGIILGSVGFTVSFKF